MINKECVDEIYMQTCNVDLMLMQNSHKNITLTPAHSFDGRTTVRLTY